MKLVQQVSRFWNRSIWYSALQSPKLWGILRLSVIAQLIRITSTHDLKTKCCKSFLRLNFKLAYHTLHISIQSFQTMATSGYKSLYWKVAQMRTDSKICNTELFSDITLGDLKFFSSMYLVRANTTNIQFFHWLDTIIINIFIKKSRTDRHIGDTSTVFRKAFSSLLDGVSSSSLSSAL